jgi:Flp pilus assembly pilin Flp
MTSFIRHIRNADQGQALVEYALILSLVSLVSLAALTLLGTNVNSALNSIAVGL